MTAFTSEFHAQINELSFKHWPLAPLIFFELLEAKDVKSFDELKTTLAKQTRPERLTTISDDKILEVLNKYAELKLIMQEDDLYMISLVGLLYANEQEKEVQKSRNYVQQKKHARNRLALYSNN